METRKDVPGYEGRYQVSNRGDVRSADRILKTSQDRKGYLRVKLYGDQGHKTIKVHRIVAEAFIPNPEGKEQINHKNGDKTDNRVENLEWATQSENQRHRFDVLGQVAKGAPPTPVVCIETGVVFPSLSEAARQLGLEATNICKVCKGRLRSPGGYQFKYKE